MICSRGAEVETRQDEGTRQKTKQDAITLHFTAFVIGVVATKA